MGEMTAHLARWVLPVSGPPIEHGAVVTANGRVEQVGGAAQVLAGFSGSVQEHGEGAILPGLVNCHTHLEFSALESVIPPQERWEDWLAAALQAYGGLSPEEVEAGIARGIAALYDSGTILAGEVSNTGRSRPQLAGGPLKFHLFYECLGFDLQEVEALEAEFPFLADGAGRSPDISAGAHAPYSVSPALFKAIARWNRARGRMQAVHLAESLEEERFLAGGGGFFRKLLQARGRWTPDYKPPGLSPAAYLDSLGFWGPDTLAVHGVWLTPAEMELLARRRTWLILCPRANRYTGSGLPQVEEMFQAGVALALGTDSLAGNWDLNLFGEMLWLRQGFPRVPGGRWLELGTWNGARALGREKDFGSLTPGKRAALGFVPLRGRGDFWTELYAAGAAGQWRWIGS
jgi:cytosine/adenosine deaminase-related metal-dependent hydrolase